MCKLKKLMIKIYFAFCRIFFGIKKDVFFFVSFHGKTYSDNPKEISRVLHKLYPEYKILWAVKDVNKFKSFNLPHVKVVDINNKLKYFKNLACCKVLIDNFALPQIPKSKRQIFVQTWHGDKAIKKVVYDIEGWNLQMAEEIPGFCDYAIAGSVFGEKQYRSAFKYKGEVLNYGTPRNDILIRNDENEKQEIRRKLYMEENVKYVLYAPTFRDRFSNTGKTQKVEDVDLSSVLDVLEKAYGCKWKCFLRSHPIVTGIGTESKDERIINVASYEDMADLLLVSDILVTDYSSSAGDFALTGRPVFLYHADVEEYLKDDRKLCFKMEDSPFFVAHTQKELEELLVSVTEERAIKNCKEILKFYGDYESGDSARKIVEIILKRIEKS